MDQLSVFNKESATENGGEEIRKKLVEVCRNKEIVEINDP